MPLSLKSSTTDAAAACGVMSSNLCSTKALNARESCLACCSAAGLVVSRSGGNEGTKRSANTFFRTVMWCGSRAAMSVVLPISVLECGFRTFQYGYDDVVQLRVLDG